MQFVDRSGSPPPDALTSSTGARFRSDLEDYINDVSVSASQRRSPIDDRYLRQPSVTNALLELFARSCSYCESPIHQEDGTSSVAHHRPPGFAADQRGRTSKLHYAWLGYDWQNLYLLCDTCREIKGNKFFVHGERGKVGSSIADLRLAETALLLDPCFDDPAKHLTFYPTGIVNALSERGKSTIDVLELNRDRLVADRRRSFEELAGRIFLERRPVAIRATGSGVPSSQHVFSGPAYAGAASIALVEHMKSVLSQSATLVDLISLVSSLPRADRLAAHADFLSGRRYELRAVEEVIPTIRAVPETAYAFRDFSAGLHNIASVEIRDFKAIEHLSFSLPSSVGDGTLVPSMMILGENATGKSSVLEAIALTLLGTRESKRLDDIVKDSELSPNGLLRRPDVSDWDNVAGSRLRTKIEFLSGRFAASLDGERGWGNFQGSDSATKVVLGYGPRRFFPPRRTQRRTAPAYRVRSLFDPMAIIPNPEDWLLDCDERTFATVARALREILMLDAADFISREQNRLLIQRARGRTPLSEMSVGYKSVIAMATDIMRELLRHFDNLEYASAVVLIDEVETHLHPRWKIQLMRRLRRALPKVQFIVTTHDPLCLQGMQDKEVFVLTREKDGRIKSLENLPSVQGMRAEQILTSEFFGLGSTDPETEAKLELYHNLIARQNTLSVAESTTLSHLRVYLRDNLVVGDTIAEQALAEGLNLAAKQADVEVNIDSRPDRRSMIQSVLSRLNNIGSDRR